VELALEQGINVVRPNETTPNIQDNWTMDNAFLLSFTIASTIGALVFCFLVAARFSIEG